MKKTLIKDQAYEALREMTRKLKTYAEKPDANQAYLNKNYYYLNAIEQYFTLLETEIHDTKFNAEFLIVTDQSDGMRVKELESKLREYQRLFKRYGIDETDQAFMLHSNSERNSETRRYNSIEMAKEKWPELF